MPVCTHRFSFNGICSACGLLLTGDPVAPPALLPEHWVCVTCRRGRSACGCVEKIAAPPCAPAAPTLSLSFVGRTPATTYRVAGEVVLDLEHAAVFEYTVTNPRAPPPMTPVTIGVVLDVSASMHGQRLATAKAALAAFIDDIPLGDAHRPVLLELATFNGFYQPAVFKERLTTLSREKLHRTIRGLRARGNTNFAATVRADRVVADVCLYITDADTSSPLPEDQLLEDYFPTHLILVDVGGTGNGFQYLSRHTPIKGPDGIEAGLDAIRQTYFHHACVHVKGSTAQGHGRFSGNSGGPKLWVAPGVTRTGFFLLENFDEAQPGAAALSYAGQSVLPSGWEAMATDRAKMLTVAQQRLQTIVADYKAAVTRDSTLIDCDQEFLALAQASATKDYGVTLPVRVVEALGDALTEIKAVATAQRTEHQRRVDAAQKARDAKQAATHAEQVEFVQAYLAMNDAGKRVALARQQVLLNQPHATVVPDTKVQVVFEQPSNDDDGNDGQAYTRRSQKRARR